MQADQEASLAGDGQAGMTERDAPTLTAPAASAPAATAPAASAPAASAPAASAPAASAPPVARGSVPAVGPADLERWLSELGLVPLQRADREGVTAWDLDLDGRRRFDLRTTLILDPGLGLICWAHLAPPLGDGLRKAYRLLLQWNDDFPFAKFSIAADGRPILAVELPGRFLDRDELGLALCRIVGIADRLLDQTAGWLWIGGQVPAGYGDRPSRNPGLLARHAGQLPELFEP